MSRPAVRQKPIHRGRIPTPGGGVYAASPAQGDVADAIAAANNGDTVYVPAGTANWTQPLAITKFIKLIGAGSDQTVITWTGGTAANYYDSQYYIITFAPVPVVSDLPWGISGIGFNLASKWHGIYLYNASATYLTKMRLTDLDLIAPRVNARAIRPVGNVAGVVDGCYMEGACGVQGYGHENWNLYSCPPGSSRQLYYEQCTWKGPAGSVGVGGGGGVGFVIRYCAMEIDSSDTMATFFESHGNQSNNGGAMMNAEVYNNTFTSSVSTGSELFVLRGGSLICFGNTVGATGFYSSYIKVYEEIIDSCNGAYPVNSDGLHQHPNRAYAWSNTRNSVELVMRVPVNPRYDVATQTSNASGGWVDYSEPTWPYYDAALASYGVVPQYDRDLFGYNPTFDGTANYNYASGNANYLNSGNVAGVGVGLLAARPASCTVTGAAWWATDTETLYRWTGSEWVAYFTPYTYPHPLRSTW